MVRHCLTDEQWGMISDLFPKPKTTGRPPVDRRQVVNGILWIMRTGAPWRDLPSEFGKWGTVWDLFDTWNSTVFSMKSSIDFARRLLMQG